MNKGLIVATGDYVTFINAGDVYCDINVIDELFEDQTNFDVVYHNINVINQKDGS